jgi:ABC transporter substrate binding protein
MQSKSPRYAHYPGTIRGVDECPALPHPVGIQRGAGALVVGTFPWCFDRRDQILRLAARHKIPATYPSLSFVYEGGLMSYSAGREAFREVASHYVGQILKGAKPSDLPVQQPTNTKPLSG